MALENVKLSFSKDASNPTVLSERELNTLVALVGDTTINLSVSGYVKKNSIYKSQYKALTAYSGLSGTNQVQYDSLLDDSYSITPVKNQITEGEDTGFVVTGTVAASSLKYTIAHSITISYAPSEATELQLRSIIQNRIKIVNNKLVCENAQENASWIDQVTITTVPMGMEDEPTAVKTCQVIVQAIAVSDLSISGIDDVDSGATLTLGMNLVPANNTKVFNSNSVTWSTNGGSINQTGLLTAPTVQGRYQVTVGLTLYSTGTFKDTIEHSEQFVVTGALFSAEKNPIVFEAMKQAYSQFADRTAISTKDVKTITDIAPLITILKDEENEFDFTEFEYFENVSNLPSNVCFANSNIKSIKIPSKINSISGISGANNNNALGFFANCKKLKNVNLGNVETISGGTITSFNNSGTSYQGAFSGCTALEEIDCSNVKYITGACDKGTLYSNGTLNSYYGAFSGCTALRNIQFNKLISLGVNNSSTEFGGKWDGIQGTLIDNIQFPNTLIELGKSTFCNSNLTGVVDLSNTNISVIDCRNTRNNPANGLFTNSTKITAIKFPEKELSFVVGDSDGNTTRWIEGCSSLQTLDLSKSIITNIPDKWIYNAPANLKHIYIPINNVIPCGTSPFKSNIKIFVKDSLVDTLKEVSGWSVYADNILPVSTMASYGWTV